MSIYHINYPEDKDSKYQEFSYPAGEVQIRLLQSQIETVALAKRIIVTYRGTDVMRLSLLIDAIRGVNEGHADEQILILPYLPYSRADRRFSVGDCAGLRTFGYTINGLGFTKVITFDAHSYKAKQYIANLVLVPSEDFVKDAIDGIVIKNGLSLGLLLPDKGARAKYQLDGFCLPIFTADKKRDQVTGEFLGFTVPKDEDLQDIGALLIVDDICDGGGTFTGIAKALNTATPLYLAVSHGIFSKGFGELNQYFHRIFTTDSFPDKGPSFLTKVFPITNYIKE